ncbi:segregation/condensation protein A [Prochlorococcus sp. MIT 1307]|uniref:segregation/condensation protein A n=1 Tax=Prochlorococcus sp. MIT 1307 TaxID=3096219 RepID=UPI002A7528DC|nr:segregation/condensation protein A [Prochlorococcus sp. MIT 1307]
MHDHPLKLGVDSGGARLAIRLLQDAAEKGELDPWDVDVIPVVDGFLDQLRQRIEVPRQISEQLERNGGTFERDLAESSEAFLAASVLVGLKAEVLEAETFPSECEPEESFEFDSSEQGWLDSSFVIPLRPEQHLLRRPVAPPPLRRPVTLGELIEQLEAIAEQIDSDELQNRKRRPHKRFTEREVISQVNALAHREKLPETTAALGVFLNTLEPALHWMDFELLVRHWEGAANPDLDTDRVGVFWALLFLCSQGKIELQQVGSLYAPLSVKRILSPGTITQLPLKTLNVPDASPAAA